MANQPEGSFSFGTRLGLAFTVESACCSAIMVTSVLIYILYSAVAIKRGASRKWTVSTNVHCYFINLMIFDLIQAIGGIMDVKWVAIGGVSEGPFCTAQGVLKQVGDVGVALSCLRKQIIALHTFGVLVLRRSAPTRVAIFGLLSIWTSISLIVGISFATHKGKDYYGNTQYWCWITSSYGFERIALEYFWMWLAAFINLLCYGIMALVVKGALVADGTRFRYIGRKSRRKHSLGMLNSVNLTGADRAETNAIALHMLFYPLIYIFAVSPITVVRWMAFSGANVPFAATAFASIVFSSSGVFNVLLFATTRPKLLPHREHRSRTTPLPFSVGVGSPQSSLRYTPISPDDSDGSSNWKLTPRTMPSELPILHISRDRSS
ncbi:hypothetical protein GYMLUDRAFT_148385 [Collybiopsis luxurians FD-317 M1]|nr:hypothetical protein GYMLUDRAFT_148385 [Collybiopsis luxurians FD-317 M1]